MKKILELTGVQKLSRKQQVHINGARRVLTCCPSGRGCQISFPEFGIQFCEPGACSSDGRCLFLA
ncbi:hypothetical protein [Aquimarina sp. AU474]|uniref:hypothetical protein n=1 Tax=Aquimarina sp. AU474 TaxID=2108529 RepID=UPI000D6986B4|nr:hypothetical protein [Aquimarina sp. AU474]